MHESGKGGAVSLEEEIITWTTGRPTWQQQAVFRIATGGPDQAPAAIATELAAGNEPPAQPLTPADLPGGGASGVCVQLRSVTPLAHVNALLDGQCLTLSPTGITVVYGDNASGKSGYARMLKQVVHARVRGEVLTDVFEDRRGDQPSALIGYDVDGAEDKDTWPEESNPVLRQIGFYDDACGEAYITHDTAVSYRPSTLVLFDRLIELCDAVKAELDILLSDNTQAKVVLPAAPEGTAIATFLAGLTGTTKPQAIDNALTVPADVDEKIAALADEEARLRATDPSKERTRLTDLATKLATIRAHLASLDAKLSDEVNEKLAEAEQKAADHRAAANLASSTSFDGEPLTGVGSETWRAMWDAARRYSEAEAYEGRDFPATEADDRCVLCQQALSGEAGDRLHRFHQFMADDTEKLATESQRAFETLVAAVRTVQPEPTTVAVALATVETSDGDLAEKCRDAIGAFKLRQDALLRLYAGEEVEVPVVPDSPVAALQTASESATAAAATINDAEFRQTVGELAARRAEMEGRRTAGAARDDITREVARLAERRKIEAAKKQTDTSGITRKSTELARDHVTAVILDRFTRESHDLKLERVTLDHPGGKKGQLMQRPTLLAAKQDAQIDAVLSEGEQTALGLAGFLTEAYFDETKSGIVLDDPVTSLDHIRRSHVASRLCDFARDRQVTVFTHDLTFVGDIRKAAEEAGVLFTERAVERHGDGSIGMCRDQHPWKAKDAKARLAQLGVALNRIKKEKTGWDTATYEREVADWAGSLSETWELIVDMDIVNQVVDKGTSEVRPKMFRVLAQITDDDDKEFQASYGRCSKWLRRHRKSTEVNYVAPDVDEMEAELTLVQTWHDRVRKYANT
jgi:energy-coupling factor transporter ATP-binding protein EcfA2